MDGAVDELIGQHQIARGNLFAQAAHRAAGDDAADPQFLERKDVRAIGHRGRIEHMALAVTAEQGHRNAAHFGRENGR